jgi:hypothetical protein
MSADCRSPIIRDASVTAKDETQSERSTMVSAIRAVEINNTDVVLGTANKIVC